MAVEATIAERPVPPKGGLSFPALLTRIVRNPVTAWGVELYDEPIVPYRLLGHDTVLVMDPDLIQAVLRDGVDRLLSQLGGELRQILVVQGA